MKSIIRAPQGTNREIVPLSQVHVPDLWHIAKRREEEGFTEEAEQILECWHLCIDLLMTKKSAMTVDRDNWEREASRLRAVNTKLLEALEGLTVIDTITKGPLQGAIIIGPQGWAIACAVIEEARK